MTARLMVQGTRTGVGKSLLVAALARAFRRRGIRVWPFKPQNMSNNSAVTVAGEIARAQALQALAAGLPPSPLMNPVLLKPEAGGACQVVVRGRALTSVKGTELSTLHTYLKKQSTTAFEEVANHADLVLIEGAGSPAEINLRPTDLANMGFAALVDAPVVLVGDLDLGGAFASLLGTLRVLEETDDARRVQGLILNRFRGDLDFLGGGIEYLEARSGLPCLGVVPFAVAALDLPAEDAAVRPDQRLEQRAIRVGVVQYPCASNLDDLDPLRADPSVDLRWLDLSRPLQEGFDLLVLPGSKSPLSDMAFIRNKGWCVDLLAYARRGGALLGICGGYQILGRTISDPCGRDGTAGTVHGLGLLDVCTTMSQETKVVREVVGEGLPFVGDVRGYEIHVGTTEGPDCSRPFLRLEGAPHGAASGEYAVWGCYLHGLLHNDGFRTSFLGSLARGFAGDHVQYARTQQALEAMADHVEECLDLDHLLQISTRRIRRPISLSRT